MTSHEFRTLIHTLSSAELPRALQSPWGREKISRLRHIQAAVKHITNLLNDVLLIKQQREN